VQGVSVDREGAYGDDFLKIFGFGVFRFVKFKIPEQNFNFDDEI